MEDEGYSPVFYVMLIIGIVGVLGFFIVAAGAAGGAVMIAELETQLEQAQAMTPEAAVESAIMVYLAAKAQIDEYNRIADAAKKLIGDVMLETGATAYSTKAGKVSMTNASMSVSYDTKALDALIASSDEVRRMLEPHRKVSERAGTMRIVGAK